MNCKDLVMCFLPRAQVQIKKVDRKTIYQQTAMEWVDEFDKGSSIGNWEVCKVVAKMENLFEIEAYEPND